MNKIYKLHQCFIVDEGEKDVFDGHFRVNLKGISIPESSEFQVVRTVFKGESVEEILRDSILSTAVVLFAAQSGYHSREKAIELAKTVLTKL